MISPLPAKSFNPPVTGTPHLARATALCLLIVWSSVTAHAQTPLETLVSAEKAFADMSVEKNIRAAFLEFFDDNTIAFNNGQPVNGWKEWEKRPEGNGYLFWWPVYADVAASGDFGYTTGPAVFGPDKSTRETKGGQYYASVWKKNAAGQWKVLADIGSAYYNPADNLGSFSTTTRPSRGYKKDAASVRFAVLDEDRNYDAQLTKKKTSFDASLFSVEGRVHRRGAPPVISRASISTFTEPQEFYFEHVGGEVASSNDMAYTYGLVKITTTKDGKEVITPGCYMRVWKIEDGKWKIVLDVIGG